MERVDSERILNISVYLIFVKRTRTIMNYGINGSLTFPSAYHLLAILPPTNIHLSQEPELPSFL